MITISAFGGFQITIDGRLAALSNRKSQALLIYLARSSGEQQERSVLADLFWAELPEAGARNNLSKALGQIRKLFKQADTAVQPVEATRQTVRMISSSSWQLDSNLFNELVEEARATTDTAASAAHLEEAVALYRGDFLDGLSLDDSPTFESWLLLQRENLMLMARDSYQRLADYYLRLGVFEMARDHARSQLALDAWHEEGHRQLMRALDGMGQRADALAQYELCRQILHSELGLEPESVTRELYEQIKAGNILPERQTAAQPAPLRLPKRLLPLVGRERELAVLQEDLADPAGRLITIVGPGGVGKTSLALEAAYKAASAFDDGAAFVPLEYHQPSPGSDLHDLLATAVGTALELTFSGREPIQMQLYKQLRDTELLLLLDNFEHLMMGSGSFSAVNCAAFVTSLLEQAPGIKLLVTSRERFSIPAEYVLSLGGLPVPDADVSLPALGDYSSVRLFVEQAHRIQRGFQLTADNGADVAEICRLLDGLPLGIELAARWVPHFSCSEIASAILENLNFLAAEHPQVTQRHQSIRATFSYSWRMLTAGEQQMLSRLSIILGSFGREAAREISEGSLGTLIRLQGKSLLRQESPGFYSLHQLLQQYAAERLEAQPPDEQADLRRRFCAYYLQIVVEQAEGFNRVWLEDAMREIAANFDNVLHAWQLALGMRSFDLLAKALQPLFHYLRLQGLYREGLRLFDHAVATFRLLHDQGRHKRQMQELLGRSLLRQGRLAWLLADMGTANHLLQEGLDHLRQAGANCDLSRGNAYLGESLLLSGQREEAAPLLNKSLELYREEGDKNGLATALGLQAVCASQAGEFDKANQCFQESIAISHSTGNRRLEGRSLHDWGMILFQQGKIDQAAQCFRGSQVIARDLNLHMPIAFNQIMLARNDRHLGHYDHARRRLVEGLPVLEGSGYAFYTIRALNMLGEVEAILGNSEEARGPLEEALFRLNNLQTADSSIYTYLALDFLMASAYLFAATSRDGLADHYLRLALKHIDPESDLDLRSQQLALDLSKRDLCLQEIPVPAQEEETPLAEVLSEFQF